MPIERRNFLKSFAIVGGLAMAPRFAAAEEQAARNTRAMPTPRIKDISVIECEPAGVRLTVVKITTDQDGLYGYGCATFTQRADLVRPAVERYLKPLLLGKTTDRIEDIWQSCYDSSYWKNGPVLNNANSGIDQALWDIKGRQAGLPVYQEGNAARLLILMYMQAERNSKRLSRTRRNTWRRVGDTCACRSDCPAWLDTVRNTSRGNGRRRCMISRFLIERPRCGAA